MTSLYTSIDRLRDSLISSIYENIVYSKQTVNEIREIRLGLLHLKAKNMIDTDISFIENAYDFDSIKGFFDKYHMQLPQEWSLEDTIRFVLDPLCIKLMDTDYEVTVKQIKNSLLFQSYYPPLLNKLNDLDLFYENNDVENLISTSMNILQSLYKDICEKRNLKISDSASFNAQYTYVAKELNLLPASYKDDVDLQKFTSAVREISLKVNQLRNLYSSSHGKSLEYTEKFNILPKHHMKLVVDSTKTIANFILGSFDYQNTKSKI